ncbi:MAG: rRNA maturation RNase YbeY [Clostridia bacterium]|nr:rRNA maturation RNase YbeY [Clostridia bacterium]
MKHTVILSNEQDKVKLTFSLKRLIKKAIVATLRYEDFERPCEVSVTLVDNDAIREINREHRGIDRPTDVLSFPMFDEDFDNGEMCILGDIVLSVEKAVEQAEAYGHSLRREVAFLTVHSVLHLLGFDHEEGKAAESEMFAMQEEILSLMKLTR